MAATTPYKEANEVTITITQCGIDGCTDHVVQLDNNVWLDAQAVPRSQEACWSIMTVGPMHLAAAGGPTVDDLGHTLHRHQPEEL